ncbi:ATP-dependent Clp protease proteolytic subunit [Bradyrhizobium sp. LA6.12]
MLANTDAFARGRGFASEIPSCAEGLFSTPHTVHIAVRGEIKPDGPTSASAVRRALQTSAFRHIHLILDCLGGHAAEAWRMYTLLRAQPVPVSAHVAGGCRSAGLIVLAAAGYRSCRQDSLFLLHEPRVDRRHLPEWLTATRARQEADDLCRLRDDMIDLLQSRTDAERSWLDEEVRSESDFDAVKALEQGFVHCIDGLGDLIAPIDEQPGVYVPKRLRSNSYRQAWLCDQEIHRIRGSSRKPRGREGSI